MDEAPREIVADNLRRLMAAEGITKQVELEKLSGVRQTTLSSWLRPHSKTVPKLDNLGQIASAFGISALALLIPGLPADREGRQGLDCLLHDYLTLPVESRRLVRQVAAEMARPGSRPN